MSTYAVHYDGKRYTVKATAMQKLQVLLDQVQAQLKRSPSNSDGQLLVNGSPADLTLPIRFANLPSNAKLEVKYGGAPSRLGIQDSANVASSKLTASKLAQADQQPLSSGRSGQSEHASPASSSQLVSDRQRQATTSDRVTHNPDGAQPSEGAVPSKFLALGLDREVSVFSRTTIEAAAPLERGNDVPDSFYVFGPDDFAAVMRGYSKSKSEAEKGLRTAKMREKEEQERASRFPSTAIRIEFPDGYLLQMQFKSLEHLSAIQENVSACLLPQIAQQPWHLYVAPPKQVLSDTSATVFQAGLCPAAKVYFGSQREGPFLRPEITALEVHHVPMAFEEQAAPDTNIKMATGAAKAEAVDRPKARQDKGDKKVPAWMKLSKK